MAAKLHAYSFNAMIGIFVEQLGIGGMAPVSIVMITSSGEIVRKSIRIAFLVLTLWQIVTGWKAGYPCLLDGPQCSLSSRQYG